VLEKEWARLRRQAQPISLIMADIDCFKGYCYGHAEGDNCLRKVAATLIPHSDSMISDYVTIAMGVASIIPVDNNPRRLVELAVANLYKAMRNGRNQVVAD
jgi:PleD family two-component response regulator